MFSYVIETHVEVWENSKLRGNTRPTGSCSHFNFSFTQTSTCVSITVWKHGKCFLFLMRCNWDRSQKTSQTGNWNLNLWISRPMLYRLSYRSCCHKFGCELGHKLGCEFWTQQYLIFFNYPANPVSGQILKNTIWCTT